MAVTAVLTPVLQKAEKVDFTKRLEAATKELYFLTIQSKLETFNLNAFLYVLKRHLCEEKYKREIPLALYIRLEYSIILMCLVQAVFFY